MPWQIALGLAVAGALSGSLVNAVANRGLIEPVGNHPWFPAADLRSKRTAVHWVPILGWFMWRKLQHADPWRAWVRPLAVELLTTLGLPGWWYLLAVRHVQLPVPLIDQTVGFTDCPHGIPAMLVASVVVQWLLLMLMLAATLTDLDDRVIPDMITIPGTLLLLAAAAIYPWGGLPVWSLNQSYSFLHALSPERWPAEWEEARRPANLGLAWGAFTGWCVALLPWVVRMRHGVKLGLAILWRHLRYERASLQLLAIWAAGSLCLLGFWYFASGPRWVGLQSACLGLLFGGGIVWSVRIFGGVLMGREAMGFGDVTLLAMVGAYMGWQTCLAIFFMAPFLALGIGGVQMVLGRGSEIPYGPFLCLATFICLIYWKGIWQWASPLFGQGWLVPAMLLACLGILLALLALIRLFKTLLPG